MPVRPFHPLILCGGGFDIGSAIDPANKKSTVANRAPVLSYVKRLNPIAAIIIYPFCAGAACELIACGVYVYAFFFCVF